MKIELKFSIGAGVRIKELLRAGIVKSIWLTVKGIQYEVRYFDNGKAQEVYFYENELE